MKQRQLLFATLTSMLLLLSGGLITLVSVAGWNLVILGGILGTLCIGMKWRYYNG